MTNNSRNSNRKSNNSKHTVTKKKVVKRKRKKRRLNKGFVILVILICIFIGLIINRNSIFLWRKGYSREDRKILLNLSKEELKDYLDLDTALDLSIWNEYANHNHYYDYVLYKEKFNSATEEQIIKYVDSLYDLLPALNELGFTKEFCRNNYGVFSIEDFNTIVNKSYSFDTVNSYLQVKGCQISDLSSYLQSGLDPVQAVLTITYPFIDSSIPTDVTYKIVNPMKYDVLIKTGFTLGADYEPSDLKQLDLPLSDEITSAFLRKKAADALTEMANDAKSQGLIIGIRSAYRSYADQEETYNYYNSIYGYYYASQLVSVPGSSEHQLGLGVDLTSQSVIDGTYGAFDQSEEYPWVIQNCYKYGFILRYPENKTNLTGAMNEPWHFRYVGVKAATEIHDNDITLEEYIMKHGFDYDLVRN